MRIMAGIRAIPRLASIHIYDLLQRSKADFARHRFPYRLHRVMRVRLSLKPISQGTFSSLWIMVHPATIWVLRYLCSAANMLLPFLGFPP
jgi:hypothetical protein